MLVEHFVDLQSKKLGKTITKVSKHSLDLMEKYEWPGNIRELKNIVHRAMITSKGTTLKIEESMLVQINGNNNKTPKKSLEDIEREYITKVLKECQWRIEGSRGAANILQVNPSTLRNRMNKLNISRPD